MLEPSNQSLSSFPNRSSASSVTREHDSIRGTNSSFRASTILRLRSHHRLSIRTWFDSAIARQQGISLRSIVDLQSRLCRKVPDDSQTEDFFESHSPPFDRAGVDHAESHFDAAHVLDCQTPNQKPGDFVVAADPRTNAQGAGVDRRLRIGRDVRSKGMPGRLHQRKAHSSRIVHS